MISITMSNEPSPLNELLRQQLLIAQKLDQEIIEDNATGVMLEVPNTGRLLSSAYEQLRNAAEYSEEHLLLQRAIKRFCYRNLFITRRRSQNLGTELIVELVQASYLRGDQISKQTAQKIDVLISKYMDAYAALRKTKHGGESAQDWVLALISSETENLLTPHHAQQATVYFAYHHFLESISRDQFVDYKASDRFEFCMFMAVHQALLKSDIDTVRYALNVLYQQNPDDVEGFRNLNSQIDLLFNDLMTLQLKRTVSRYGAPFRILKSMIEDRTDMLTILLNKQQFMDAYSWQVTLEYRQLHNRLNRLFVKSIVFLIISKFLIGIAIEVPYDLIVNGVVAFMPLTINLFFPPLYLASLRLSLHVPSKSNAKTIRNYMEKLLYENANTIIKVPRQRNSTFIVKFAILIAFLLPLAITVFILDRLGFNVVQMIIFFVFFSTASFLGFRLSVLIRELELTTRQTGLLASMRDFFYLPFILVGQWLSRKYSKINAVARLLDIGVELPLKTVLRLLRQWIRFLNEKHEELY